jgi:hypothetical protein
MTKMNQGKYTCNKGDGNMTDICHMRHTCLVLATTCNMTNSNMWLKLVIISTHLDKRLVIWLKEINGAIF